MLLQTYTIILLQEDLVPLVLSPHSKDLLLQLHHLLVGRVLLLLHMRLQKLFLSKALSFLLFALSLFKLALLSELSFLSTTFFRLTRCLKGSLLVFILLENAGLFIDLSGGWSRCR